MDKALAIVPGEMGDFPTKKSDRNNCDNRILFFGILFLLSDISPHWIVFFLIDILIIVVF